MGTETQFANIRYIPCLYIPFGKLNNPLMGTETYIFFNTVEYNESLLGKLNNPLMGTETLRGTNNPT